MWIGGKAVGFCWLEGGGGHVAHLFKKKKTMFGPKRFCEAWGGGWENTGEGGGKKPPKT